MKENIKININNEKIVVIKEGQSILELIKYINEDENSIIAGLINNEVVELSYILKEDTTIEFIRISDRIGAKIYRSGLKYIYITAIKELYGINTKVELKHSLDKGIYTKLNIETNQMVLNDIKNKMLELVNRNLKFEKITTSRKEAIKYFESINENEKALNYKQMTNDTVTLYGLLDYYNYFYSFMPVSTGILKSFDLTLIENDGGIMLRYPTTYNGQIPVYTHMEKVLDVFKTYGEWSNMLKVNYK